MMTIAHRSALDRRADVVGSTYNSQMKLPPVWPVDEVRIGVLYEIFIFINVTRNTSFPWH
jgi:hypothetical protein